MWGPGYAYVGLFADRSEVKPTNANGTWAEPGLSYSW